MSGPSLRFLLPGVDAPGAGAGLQVAPTGRVELVSGEAEVRQSVLLLLATVPGERVMRPDYGCALDRLVFSPNDDTTAGLALHEVAQALARFEPRVDVIALDTRRPDDDDGRLDIHLTYRVRTSMTEDDLVVPLRVDGSR